MSLGMWVIAAAQFGASMIDMFNTRSIANYESKSAELKGKFERSQIKFGSYIETQERLRRTDSLLGAQRARLGAAGVAGGRTARLLDAQVRMAAGREQMQAQTREGYAIAASRSEEAQSKVAAAQKKAQASLDLLSSGLSIAKWMYEQP